MAANIPSVVVRGVLGTVTFGLETVRIVRSGLVNVILIDVFPDISKPVEKTKATPYSFTFKALLLKPPREFQ